MEATINLTLGEIVKQQYKAAQVFEKFGLDFCCMGTQSLEEACQAGNLDPAAVLLALKDLEAEGGDGINFDTWSLDLLADYIYQRHHHYVEEKTPIIKTYLNKICAVHGDRHPELLQIRQIFQDTSGALAVHMKKEELMLFPYIKRLAKALEAQEPVSLPLFGSVSNPVQALHADHLDEGVQLQKMAALSNDYTPPSDACATYTVTYQMLKEYEQDMHIHIHLENNILFSKAIQLEAELNRLKDR